MSYIGTCNCAPNRPKKSCPCHGVANALLNYCCVAPTHLVRLDSRPDVQIVFLVIHPGLSRLGQKFIDFPRDIAADIVDGTNHWLWMNNIKLLVKEVIHVFLVSEFLLARAFFNSPAPHNLSFTSKRAVSCILVSVLFLFCFSFAISLYQSYGRHNHAPT